MSNNDDNDMDVENFDDGGFDDFSKKNSLGDMWKNNPMVKIGVILAGLAVVGGALVLFGGPEEKETPSAIATRGNDVNEAPGSSEVSSTMKDSIEETNMQRAEDALRKEESAVPMPYEPPKGQLPVPAETPSGEDPLDRWKRMQEERVRQQETLKQTRPPGQQGKQVDTKTPAINAMAKSMSTQMQSMLKTQAIDGPKNKNITDVKFLEEVEEKKRKKLEEQNMRAQAAQAQTAVDDDQVEDIILPAGTIEYGQSVIEANTDAPGPVMAQIISGPLRGSRVIGSFTSTDDYITLNFNTIVIDGIDYPIEAVAIDPNTTLPGMVTEIDHRYFKRIILPMAAEFVTGFADALSESGTTSVFISDSSVTQSSSDKDSKQEVASGVSEAGDKLSEILDEEAENTKPMLRLASGTPMGILFIAPVTDTNLESR